MSEEEQAGHGPTECAWDETRQFCVIVCICGFEARGDTWGECGGEMDDHLGEHEEVQ